MSNNICIYELQEMRDKIVAILKPHNTSWEKVFNAKVDQILVLFDQNKRFAEGFKRGQESINRKNQSGCCCIIDADDNVILVCGAHQNWLEEKLDISMKER